ncbi:MAG TPA: calcium/sodium antiporter [Methanosarcinales archaeon]|nr:calcium/sodium antiporter [Methanosarcinales archaeon]
MLTELAIILTAAIFLSYSSDWLIDGASRLSRIFGISEFMIGLTIVSIGTSFPEIAVAAYSSVTGNTDLAFGNIIGSNITNIALILGASSLIRPSIIDPRIHRDAKIHVLILAAATCFFLYNSKITRLEGVLLLLVYGLYLWDGYRRHHFVHTTAADRVRSNRKALAGPVFLIVVGAFGVFVSCNFLVDAAVGLASELAVSATIIGLTLVALGTSLPELAVSIAAARKNYGMMVLGNVIGSNIANILLALGIGAAIRTIPLADGDVLVNDIVLMVFLAMAMVIFMRYRGVFDRMVGLMFIMAYAIFISMSFM